MKKLALLMLIVAPLAAEAAVDLTNCTEDGRPIAEQLCKGLRQAEASNQRVLARQAEDREALQRAKAAEAKLQADLAAQRESDEARWAAERAKQAAEDAEWKQKSAELQQSLKASEKQRDQLEAGARQTCGQDFGVPRVGMLLDRARTCLGSARLVGQVNRKDGVASVYTTGRVQLYVMEGKVVAWQALR